MPAVRVETLPHHDLAVAAAIHAVQMAAYAQEALLLDAQHFPPLQTTVDDVRCSTALFLGVRVDTDIVGAMAVGIDAATRTADIESLTVAPAHQRRGVGRLLLATAIARFDACEITVSTGAKNTPALALYDAFGFAEFDRCVVGPERLALVKLRRLRGAASAILIGGSPA